MSKASIKYAKSVSERHFHRSPLPALLIKREVTVLKALATWYNDDLRCAYPSLCSLATEAHMSERNCQRGLAGLELKGLIRRLPGKTVRHGSQTSNEYEFPALGLVDENDKSQAAARKKIFTLPRLRMMPVQLCLVPMETPAPDDSAGALDEDASMTDDSVEAVGDHLVRVHEMVDVTLVSVSSAPVDEDAVSDDSAACGNSVLVSPGGCHGVTGGVTLCHPVELYNDMNGDKEQPISSLRDAHEVQNMPDIRRARATASTTANAKTGASEAARVPAEGSRRERLPRLARGAQAGAVRAGLDGEDAAVWDVVSDVLKDCGIAPERCTRRLRDALEAALRLRMENAVCSAEDAGILAVERLRYFRDLGNRIDARWSLPVFFADGHWLYPGTWR